MFQIVWKNGKETPHVNAYSENEVKTFLELLDKAGVKPTVYHKSDKAEPEKKKEKLASVAFKLYDYIVPDDAEEGDIIEVISGGEIRQLEILKVGAERKPGITYVEAERLIKKGN